MEDKERGASESPPEDTHTDSETKTSNTGDPEPPGAGCDSATRATDSASEMAGDVTIKDTA